ncbi:MAG: hypothetical protein KDG89_18185 [Geminicoccaceae bacterium]|nr:hypothetical protein [Geminicoccaceae bacterium]
MARFYFNPALRHLAGRSARVDGGLRRVEKGLLRLVWGATSGLGLERASALGAALGGLFGPRSRKYRHARESLMRAFPERDPAWIEARARGVWRQIGRVLAEYPHIGELADPMNGRIRFESAVDMDEVRRSPVGWVFLAMHQANWNLPGVAGALAGFPLDVVYRAQPDPELEAMVEGYRNLMPCGFIPVDGGPRRIIASLRQGRGVGLLIDHRVDGGEPVPFFGEDAPTATVPARIALKLGVPVVPVRLERLPGVRFRLSFDAPLRPERYRGMGEDEAGRRVMADVHARFEDWIRAAPEDWACIKRRWPKRGAPAAAAPLQAAF